jgi:uncharacterized protein (UPF0335 family)
MHESEINDLLNDCERLEEENNHLIAAVQTIYDELNSMTHSCGNSKRALAVAREIITGNFGFK